MGGKDKASSLWGMLKQAASDFMEDRALRLSAAMAYYAIFSIGPLLFLVVGIAGLALGEETVRKELHQQLQSIMGEQSSGIVESMMSARSQGGSLLATVIGGIGLVLGASGVFGQLQDALNTIWEVKAKPGKGIWGFLWNRFLSFGMVLVIGFLLLISMILTTIVQAASSRISTLINVPEWATQGVNFLAAFAVITLLFAAIFKFLPDVKIKWSDIWVGAIVTALLYTIGKMALAWYLGRESTASAYGAGGAFIIILLYIYYSSIILFFGAEFTQVYAAKRGSRIVPSEYAERVTDQERAQQGMPRSGKGTGKGENRPGGTGRPVATPSYAFNSPEHFMKASHQKIYPKREGLAPIEQIKAKPYSFVGLAVTAGVAAGLLFKFKMLRTGLKWYLVSRRIF